MAVLEVHNAKKCVFLVRRAEHAYGCTDIAIRSVFGYLDWVCLQCTVPKHVYFWYGALVTHMSTPNLRTQVSLET